MEHSNRKFSQTYYDVGNGHQILDYIYTYNLGFSFGNAAKYLIRCGRKDNNSAESDLNKALNYIASAKEEFSFFHRFLLRLFNSMSFENLKLNDVRLSDILNAIIKFKNPDDIIKMIIEYANYRGIKVHQKYIDLYE